MDGDRPITRREDDRLGFASVAEHLARAILGLPASQGFVFGIEGKWGSGKSTLINLTVEALKVHGDAAPEVIAFSPWLVGDRDELLRSLFDELAAAAVNIDPVDTRRETVEHPFGTLKMWMGATHFLMKTLPNVATEMALHVLAYNLTRVMNIVGIKPLLVAIRA